MKKFITNLRAQNPLLITAVFVGLTLGAIQQVAAQAMDSEKAAPAMTNSTSESSTSTDEAAAAWKLVKKAAQPPSPPEEWSTNSPSEEEQINFFKPKLVKAADMARDFYTKYPTNAKADEARKLEVRMLTIVSRQFGDTNQADRLDALEQKLADSPNATEEDKIRVRLQKVHKLMEGLPATVDELEKTGRAIQKDFPDQTYGYQILAQVLESSTGDKVKTLGKELLDSNAPDGIKSMVKAMLKSIEAVGKPVDIKYTSVDGRSVDISKMNGKVVLVDFWATWCGPCMAELPHVKETYAKLHPKGFEIVGISFDQDKDALLKTTKEKEMTWPQFFDGKGWQNQFGAEFGIQSIPTMWLVDKKGILRDANGREDLQSKVEKLLAEN